MGYQSHRVRPAGRCRGSGAPGPDREPHRRQGGQFQHDRLFGDEGLGGSRLMLFNYSTAALICVTIRHLMSVITPVREKHEIGLAVADFSLPLISGEGERSLVDIASGKQGAVIVFWSGFCSHCVRYDDYLNRFSGRYPELALAAVASRYGESADQIQAIAAE